VLKLYKETVARWIEVSLEIYRALNLDRNESIENLLARQKVTRWIEEAVENLSRRNPETLMDQECNKIYQEKKKEGLDRREFVEDLSRNRRA